jgi:hypothetical protein
MRGHSVTIGPDKVEIAARDASGRKQMASITLTATGNLSIEAARSIELKAPSIAIDGNVVKVEGDASTEISGGGTCSIKAGVVKIN